MPSYYNYSVPVPKGKNLTMKKIGGTYYVYYTYRRQKTKSGNLAPLAHTIGKLVPDSDPPMMYPNLSYYTHFAEPSPNPVTSMKHRNLVSIGPYVVFNKIVSDCQLDRALKMAIPDATTAEMIMDVAAYEIVNEASPMKFFPVYAAENMSFTTGMKIFSDSTVAKFTRTLDDAVKEKFLRNWARGLPRTPNAVIFQGATSTINNRVEKPMNYAIVYDAGLGLPVYYEACYGTAPDLAEVAASVKALGYGILQNVLDGTDLPRRDINKYLTSTVNPIVVIKGIRKPSAEYRFSARGKFEGKEQYRLCGTDIFACTETVKLYADEPDVYYFHVFYDEHDADQQKKMIGQTVDQYLSELDQLVGKAREDEVAEKYAAYFNLEYEPKRKSQGVALLSKVERNIPAIQRALDEAGYFTVVSPTIRSAEEVYKLISVQDMKEDLFVWDQPFLGATQASGSTVENSEASSAGRFFVEFVASIIRSGIYRELRKRNHDITDKLYGYAVDDIVKELRSVSAALRPDEKYGLKASESPLVSEILDMFSLTADSTTEAVSKINQELDLPPKTPAIHVQQVSLETRVDRICSTLDLLNEAYDILVKSATDAGADVDEIDQRIKAHFHPNWMK